MKEGQKPVTINSSSAGWRCAAKGGVLQASLESLLGDEGLELSQHSTVKVGGEPIGGADSGAVRLTPEANDPDLAVVVAAWPTLTNTVRQAIRELLDKACGK